MEDDLYKRLAFTFNEIPFNQMLGLQLEEVNPERVNMSFKMQKTLVGNFLFGILHGGVISSVLDMAGGMVTMAAAMHKRPGLAIEELIAIMGKTSTIDLQISYLRPGRGDTFYAQASMLKAGNRISFARMVLKNEADRLIASGSGTYVIR